MTAEIDDAAALRKSLVAAAQAPARNFFRQPGDKHEREHPVLARVVRAVEGEDSWLRGPNQAFLRVLRQAISQLPDPMTGRQPRGERPYTGPWKGAPARRIATILYGEGDADPEVRQRLDHEGHPRPLSYNLDYLPAARRLAGVESVSARERQRPFTVIREDLADNLLKMEQEAIAAHEQAEAAANEADEETAGPFAADKTPYVPRFHLTDAFTEAWVIEETDGQIMSAHRRVCLVGDAGTGKSRFILEVLSVDGLVPLWIDASADETMVSGMWDALRNYLSDVSDLTDAAVIKKAFGRLLAHPDGPGMVVIDGIPDPAILDQFIPRSANTYIFITSRRRPPKDWPWPVLGVGGMKSYEAQLMIALLLPEANADDSLALAIVMDHRPLLIEHACAFISRSGVGIKQFCTAVSQDVTNALDGIADTTNRRLTAIYRRYVAQLTEEAPESLRLLELLPFVAHEFVPPEYLMSHLLGVPYIKKEQLPLAQLAYEAATQPLEAYSLITVHEGFGVFMRPFVQHVLRQIFDDRLYNLVLQAKQMTEVSVETLYAEGWSALTVVGRETCNRVMFTHAKDRFLEGGKLAQDGTIGGVQWELLVVNLWKRHFNMELIRLVMNGTITSLQDGNGGADWLGFLSDVDDLPPIQRNERFGVAAAARSMVSLEEETDAARISAKSMSDEELRENLIDVIIKLTTRYEDSQVGTLDLRLMNTWSFDPEEEDGQRTFWRETLRAAYPDTDGQQGEDQQATIQDETAGQHGEETST